MKTPKFLISENEVEFFISENGQLYVQNGHKQCRFEDMPVIIAEALRRDIDRQPDVAEKLDELTPDPVEQLRIYTESRFGGFNHEPDLVLDTGKTNYEYCKNKYNLAVLPQAEYGRLTQRETDVAVLLAMGYSGIEICHILQIGENSYKSHRLHIYDKTGVNNRAKLTLWAVKEGLI